MTITTGILRSLSFVKTLQNVLKVSLLGINIILYRFQDKAGPVAKKRYVVTFNHQCPVVQN